LNKIISRKKTSAIFLAIVLIAGTIATISPSFIIGAAAQAEPYYGMDNRYGSYEPREYPPEYQDSNNYNSYKSEYPSYPEDNSYHKSKDSSSVILKKINCNNINSNNNGVDVNLGIPNNDAIAEAQASDNEDQTATANGWGYDERNKQNDNDFKFVCINNNDNENNVVVVNETTPEPPEPTITCEECFEESISPEALAILITSLEGGIPIIVDGKEITINSLAELCAALQDATLLEALNFFQRELNTLLAVSLLACLDDIFDFENPDAL